MLWTVASNEGNQPLQNVTRFHQIITHSSHMDRKSSQNNYQSLGQLLLHSVEVVGMWRSWKQTSFWMCVSKRNYLSCMLRSNANMQRTSYTPKDMWANYSVLVHKNVEMKHTQYANGDDQWWLKHGKFIDTQIWKSGLFSWCSSWNAFSFLLYRRVVPRHLEYFNFLDDPLSNNLVVCRNHPSRHQIERSPWIVKQNLY